MSEKISEKIEKVKNQTERKSGIVRIVGVNPEDEAILLGFFGGIFSLGDKFSFEKEKSEELERMIRQLSRYLKEFSLKYGAQPLDISSGNVRLLDWGKMDEKQKAFLEPGFENHVGLFDEEKQVILVFQRPGWSDSLLGLARVISHEMLHGLSFQSLGLKPYDGKIDSSRLGITKDDNEGGGKFFVIPRRGGFRVMKNEGIELFALIDESIIAELAYRFDQQYFGKIPEISESKEFKMREEFYSQNSDEETKRRHDYALVTDVRRDVVGGRISQEFLAKESEYLEERLKFDKLLDEIFEKNKDQFKDREEVFAVFAKVVMTGRLLPVARLIEKTFGKGSFRELGEDSGAGFDEEKNKQE